MLRCVAYCRVSTDHEDQMNSLENQIKHYTDLFKQDGYQGSECGMYFSKDGKKEKAEYIPSIFADEGITGTKLKNRQAFKYMIECAKRKEFDIIYVKNVARWARSVEDGARSLKELKVIGIKVIFEEGNLNNIDHEMVINMFFSQAQEESRSKSEAVKFGIRKAQKAGKYISATPYGYQIIEGYLKPLQHELDVVKEIFDLYYNQGWGSTKITRHLNGKKIPTKKNKQWAQTQIYDIITNPIYTGKQIQHTVVRTDINVDEVTHIDQVRNKSYKYSSVKPVDESEHIITQREDLRIISDEFFEAVQEENRKRIELFGQKHRPSNVHIFSNLIYCRNCGKALRRKRRCTWKRKDGTRSLAYEWVCSNHDQYYNDVCQFRNSWSERILLDRVKSEIQSMIENEDKLSQYFDDYMKTFLSTEEVTDRINDMQTQLEEVKTDIKALLKLYSRDLISEDQYVEQNNELNESRKSIETELGKLLKIDEEREYAKRKYNKFVKFLKEVNLEDLNNVILRQIFCKIESYSVIVDGKEVKDLNFVWNVLDQNIYSIMLKKAKNEILPITNIER